MANIKNIKRKAEENIVVSLNNMKKDTRQTHRSRTFLNSIECFNWKYCRIDHVVDQYL